MATQVHFGGKLVARIYGGSGLLTVDLSPYRQREKAKPSERIEGLSALDAKHGGGSFKVRCKVKAARECILSHARGEQLEEESSPERRIAELLSEGAALDMLSAVREQLEESYHDQACWLPVDEDMAAEMQALEHLEDALSLLRGETAPLAA